MPQSEAGGNEPVREPGSPTTARLAGLAVVLLIAVVAALQQASLMFRSEPGAEGGMAAAVEPPDFQTEFTAKVTAKIGFAWRSFARDAAMSVEAAARTPADKLRAAIVRAELLGPGDLGDRLDRLEAEVPEDSPLRADIDTVRMVYGGEQSPHPEAIEAFERGHGWFGRLAASRMKPDPDPVRQQLVGGGRTLTFLLVGIGAVGCAAVVAGLVLLIIGMVLWNTDPRFRRFRPLPRGGSALIETVAVFVAAFLGMKLGSELIARGFGDGAALPFTLVAQWALLALVLWGWYRGLPLRRALADLGWHRGQGIAREIGCGILGYVACVPLLVGGVLVSLLLVLLERLVRLAAGLPEPTPPSNKILEVVGQQQGTWLLVVFFLLATAWAPLAEESIFRGALYGHLRQRWPWFPAAVVTAIGFGLMHGYPIVLMGGVMALGFGFALLREWRGSIIACATAHAIHNGMVLMMLLAVMRMLGD